MVGRVTLAALHAARCHLGDSHLEPRRFRTSLASVRGEVKRQARPVHRFSICDPATHRDNHPVGRKLQRRVKDLLCQRGFVHSATRKPERKRGRLIDRGRDCGRQALAVMVWPHDRNRHDINVVRRGRRFQDFRELDRVAHTDSVR